MMRIASSAALVGLGALVAGGVVWAQTPSEISVCVEARTGYLRIGGSCAGGHTLTWNRHGGADTWVIRCRRGFYESLPGYDPFKAE
jgi:hypothetical protein